MVPAIKQGTLTFLGQRLLVVILGIGVLLLLVSDPPALGQSDQDRLFAQAVKDYNSNQFPSAQAEFERVQGTHAQEARQYIGKIKSYDDAMDTADAIMRRSREELDISSIDSAIGEYKKALAIKSDGPKNLGRRLTNAQEMKDIIRRDQEKTLCDDFVAARKLHPDVATEYICGLASQDSTYVCAGEQASKLCDKASAARPNTPALNAIAPSPAPNAPPPVVTGTSDPSDIVSQGKTAYEGNDFPRAQKLFAKTLTDPTARDYLDKISRYQNYISQGKELSKDAKYDEARIAFADAADIKSNGPGNPRVAALQMELLEGLDQFYSGEYVNATQHLDNYARTGGEKQSLAHFYLGASKLARFFVTGGLDSGLQQDALTDLKNAKIAGFKPESSDVSPRILQVYRDLASNH
jgi:hypothetical protein